MKLEVSHHEKVDGEWKCNKSLVFVCDAPPDEKDKVQVKRQKKDKKEKKAPGITQKNFGAFLSISKLKEVASFVVTWRCRFLGSQIHTKIQKFDSHIVSLFETKRYETMLLLSPRLDTSKGNGVKILVPIRPVVCLTSKLDVSEGSVRLM